MGKWTWLSLALVLVLAVGTALYAGVPISIRQVGAIGRTVTDTPAASVGTDAPTAMFMEAKGSKQGVIPGAAPDGRIPVLSLRHQVTAPHDAATGIATGKRIHQPLTISKAVDKSTPMLYAALTTNETLPKVTIKWYRGSENYFITELTNATINSIEVKPGTPGGLVEEVSFSYQRISWTSLPDNHQAMDDAH